MIERIETSYATLDLHFSPNNPDLFAVAASHGVISFYSIELDPRKKPTMKSASFIRVADLDTLVLSLAWSPVLDPSSSPSKIAFSLSSGKIGIVEYGPPCVFSRTVDAHSLEAWTVTWSTTNDDTNGNSLPLVIYSGGDDSTLYRFDLDYFSSDMSSAEAESTDHLRGFKQRFSREHEAGVTALLALSPSSTADSEVLLTGSYDGFARVLLLGKSGRRANVVAKTPLDGGVWRLNLLEASKPSPDGKQDFVVLASCMHAGSKVLKVGRAARGEYQIHVVASFNEHQSMNYAGDARIYPVDHDSKAITVVSTSFYDKLLCVWDVDVHQHI